MTLPRITGKANVLAVYGDPIAHSLSPVMHNAAFQALGWDCVYIPCHVVPSHLPEAVQAIRALDMKGVNLTIPHKQAVIPLLDEISPESQQSGSVNTVINRNGKLFGTSTDGVGLLRSLQEDGGFSVVGKRVLLLGAGGSAAAIIYSLITAGITSLTVVNRDMERAKALQSTIEVLAGFKIITHPLSEISQLDWEGIDLLINTTSVGLHENESLIPMVYLRPNIFIYDLVYKPGGTLLIQNANQMGCLNLTGFSLLLYQGVESFRLWFSQEPPINIMRKTLENFLYSTDK